MSHHRGSHNSSGNAGMIPGIVIACVAGVVFVAAWSYVIYRCCQVARQNNQPAHDANVIYPPPNDAYNNNGNNNNNGAVPPPDNYNPNPNYYNANNNNNDNNNYNYNNGGAAVPPYAPGTGISPLGVPNANPLMPGQGGYGYSQAAAQAIPLDGQPPVVGSPVPYESGYGNGVYYTRTVDDEVTVVPFQGEKKPSKDCE